MILFACVTFLLSLTLIRVMSPVGDAIIASYNKSGQTRPETSTKTVSAPRTAQSARTRPL
jgi:hypothetical protein